MNKIAFRIIGIFALATGAAWLTIAILEMGQLTTIEKFLALLFNLVANGIAIFGGYQLWKTKEIGRKLLVVWLSYQMLGIALNGFSFVYLAISQIDFRINTSAQIPLPILIGFYLLCIVALIFLAMNKVSEEIPAEDNRPLHIVAKILSLSMPGLGRMLVGNTSAGIALFFVFFSLVGSISYHSNSDDFSLFALFVNLLYKLVVWSIFASIDWGAVKSHEKSEQERLVPISNLDSSQINGG